MSDTPTFGLDKAISIMKEGGYVAKESIAGLFFCKIKSDTLCYYPQNGMYMAFAFSDNLVWDEDYYQVESPNV